MAGIDQLHVNPLAPGAPRLPRPRSGVLMPLAASAALHVIVVLAAAAIGITVTAGPDSSRHGPEAEGQRLEIQHLVFVAPALPQIGGGGGGGGNRQPAPIRRAQGVGPDLVTLRVRPPAPTAPHETAAPPAVANVPSLPSIALDARPLASGTFDQLGLPTSPFVSGTSTGSGTGGGAGTGIGTGIGSGRGPGLGPGSGGGAGGGIYRAGGAVSAPRLVTEVKPRYTPAALLARIQGTVVLEAIVTADGCTSQIRVVSSLDRGGLDDEAVAAVAQWRFQPGRLAGVPVDVLVTILLDFTIR